MGLLLDTSLPNALWSNRKKYGLKIVKKKKKKKRSIYYHREQCENV